MTVDGIERRTLLKIAAAAPFLAIAASTQPGADRNPEISAFVFDSRFPIAHEIASMSHAELHSIEGDVTALWYDCLFHRWNADSAYAVAGITTATSLFALEQMALLQGRRVVSRTAIKAGLDTLIRWRIAKSPKFAGAPS